MKTLHKNIGIIGCGNMGKALIKGLISSRIISTSRLMAFDKVVTNNTYIKRNFGIKIGRSSVDLVKHSDVIIIAVKPANLKEALLQIRDASRDKLIISIAAGITTKHIESVLGSKTGIIRVMPNTPALVGEGMSAISKGSFAKESDLKVAKSIFSSVGRTIVIDEKLQDAVTAISGSGPAYFFYFKESMIEAAVKLGLERDLATALVMQTVKGSLQLLIETGKPAKTLREAVTSKRGTTEAALKVFFNKGFKEIIHLAAKQAHQRAKELSRECL